jgi:hypothetical protein
MGISPSGLCSEWESMTSTRFLMWARKYRRATAETS